MCFLLIYGDKKIWQYKKYINWKPCYCLIDWLGVLNLETSIILGRINWKINKMFTKYNKSMRLFQFIKKIVHSIWYTNIYYLWLAKSYKIIWNLCLNNVCHKLIQSLILWYISISTFYPFSKYTKWKIILNHA